MSNEMKVQAESGRLVGGRSGDWGGPGVGDGAMSAPPPPGFKTDPGGGSVPNEPSMWSGHGDNRGMPKSAGKTSSYTDLAAALGSGLAESIDIAAQGEQRGGALLTDNFFNPKDDLNYARQTRHAASRLMHKAPTRDAFGGSGHTGPDPGSLFASLDLGQKAPPKKSFPGNSDFYSGAVGDHSRDGSSPLGAFSNKGSDHRPGSISPYDHNKSSSLGYDDIGDGMRSRLRQTEDLGLTVMEPDSHGRASRNPAYGGRQNDPTVEIQRDMQNLWSNKTPERGTDKRYDLPHGHSNSGEVGSETQSQAEEELRPFTWDVRQQESSRALAILRAAGLPGNEIRNICESLGVVETFRSDFSDRGVFFVSFYDMRAAQVAAVELKPRLQRIPGADRVVVQFCVPLNSSSQNDESLVELIDIPMEVNIDSLAAMLSSYGAVRSLKSLGGNYGGSSFVVEYHDVQDAKQAVLELESTQPWGSNVSVETGARNPSDRKRGRELLALIGRWRHGNSASRPGGVRQPRADVGGYGQTSRGPGRDQPSEPRSPYTPGGSRHDSRYDRGNYPPEPPTQLVLGPDGRYSYVVVNQSGYPPHGSTSPHHGDRVYHSHSNHGTYVTHVGQPPNHHHQYWPEQNHFSSGGSVVSASSYHSHHSGPYPSGSRSVPAYYADGGSVGSHSHMMSMPQPSTGSGDDKDNRHLMLDLDAVEAGRDSRTSLMVRNIPNKYTQQMLLNEFTENGHGPGIIDFFYLPIDFKNRCNRGYAFINFVDHRDIMAFHRLYYGKHWRTFNSDKICDITYARIQGKAAMLKRFENSALMEKDEEYKPLVFVSNGPDKGTRLPFPVPSNKG